jgi:hypothetical protein
MKSDLQFDESHQSRVNQLKEEILALEKQLASLVTSKLKNSQSYRVTASNVEKMIEQKRKELTDWKITPN